MRFKRVPLTEEQFQKLGTLSGWQLEEVPMDKWAKIPGIQRRGDTVAIMASGCIADPKLLNGIEAVAGFDILVHERWPKPGELEGNAYHYVVQKINRLDYPYMLYGPFRSGARVDHWYEAEDLDTYWSDGT